jgi:hypothetical protein
MTPQRPGRGDAHFPSDALRKTIMIGSDLISSSASHEFDSY